MKNQCLLISLSIFLLLNTAIFADTVTERENRITDRARSIYEKAKKTYNDNDCHATIDLLTTYLTIVPPEKERLQSIYSVIGWCTTYLEKGRSYTGFAGITGDQKMENKFGKEMRETKQAIP